MKPLFRCDYCDFTGVEEEVIKHEETCMHNHTRRSCSTCKHATLKSLNYECAVGKDVPKGQMYTGCDCYEWDEKNHVYRNSNPFGNLFGGLFG